MKIMYRWRRKMEFPMLDDEEFAVIRELYSRGYDFERSKEQHNKTLSEPTLEDRFGPMLFSCEKITGMRETNPFAVMRHQISRHGPSRIHCGKPFRTSEAKFRDFRDARRDLSVDTDRLS
ncbi:MAG: hypothetical protein H0X23_09935 [Rubrobacter sp.]|nr:hypothetical protein [Rubrobacter sp.]